jgi:parvulin-like peptidyl-prolyl isomerase
MSLSRLQARILIALLATCLLPACGTRPTPEVIRNISRPQTQTAIARPNPVATGPTATATNTSTPYQRPTLAPSLDLSLPIARVGDENITLGQYLARVRYERFAALDDVRRVVEVVGFSALNMSSAAPNDLADQVAAVFSTLANHQAFGRQIYNVLVRESLLRQTFQQRQLSLDADEVTAYWVRRFGLQNDPAPRAAVEAPLAAFTEMAARYSGLDEAAIMAVAESYVMAQQLRVTIGAELAKPPPAITYKVWQVLLPTATEAQLVYDQMQASLSAGQSNPALFFRPLACRYATDAATRGNGGQLGFVGKGQLPAEAALVLEAETGALIGPLQTAFGYQIYQVIATRRNADGDQQASVAVITVADAATANTVSAALQAAPADFAILACQYTLSGAAEAGNGGNLGIVGTTGPAALASEITRALNSSEALGLLPPIKTEAGYAVVYATDRQINVSNPEDLEKAQTDAFIAWQNQQADSALVAPLSDAWLALTPTDPLPKQVAPYLTEENFGLPPLVPTP